jgi:hypothetical protein
MARGKRCFENPDELGDYPEPLQYSSQEYLEDPQNSPAGVRYGPLRNDVQSEGKQRVFEN